MKIRYLFYFSHQLCFNIYLPLYLKFRTFDEFVSYFLSTKFRNITILFSLKKKFCWHSVYSWKSYSLCCYDYTEMIIIVSSLSSCRYLFDRIAYTKYFYLLTGLPLLCLHFKILQRRRIKWYKNIQLSFTENYFAE